MRLTRLLITGLSLFAGSVMADAVMTTRLILKENIKQQAGFSGSSAALPDSLFNDFVNRALVWTSIDCGGVQSRVRVITTANQAFYALPDTVVEVLAQFIKTGDVSKSIKAIYPQFAEEMGFPTSLTDFSTDEDVVPTGWSFWDDTLTLWAVPEKVDTIWFYCHVEHPALSADSMAIRLKPAYTEAALYYCCQLIMESMEEWEDAKNFAIRYETTRNKLRERYQLKFDFLKRE